MLRSSKDASQNASNQARMCRRCQESDEAKESRSLIEATTTTTGYPAAVELLGPRPRPKNRMPWWWSPGSPVHHPNQVLPLDLGSSSAPPCSTGYLATDRHSGECSKTCRVYVGEPSSSHWRPLLERPTHRQRIVGQQRRQMEEAR